MIFFSRPIFVSYVVDSLLYLSKTCSCFIAIEDIIFLSLKKVSIGLIILNKKARIHLFFLFRLIISFISNTSTKSSNPDTITVSFLFWIVFKNVFGF